jgi:hypothetical protein
MVEDKIENQEEFKTSARTEVDITTPPVTKYGDVGSTRTNPPEEYDIKSKSSVINEEHQFYDDRNLTPLDRHKIAYYDSIKNTNIAKIKVFNVLKYLIPTFFSLIVGLLAFFGTIWAYKLNNIAEPIGGIKVEIQYIKENLGDLKAQIKDVREIVNILQTKINTVK